MLPRPATNGLSLSGRKGGISLASALNGGGAGTGGVGIRERLAARSRVTNLGVVLLLILTGLSALLNLRYMLSRGGSRGYASPPAGFSSWKSFHGFTPGSLLAQSPPPVNGTQNLSHLVVVAGHAIWAGCDFGGRENDENWILEDYQRYGSVKTFWKHIERGVQVAAADPDSLLVFSGGQTRPSSLQTEAESYYSLALASGIDLPLVQGSTMDDLTDAGDTVGGAFAPLGEDPNAVGNSHVGRLAEANAAVATVGTHGRPLSAVRMTTENFALDSFQNLLFSIARFREYTGQYPDRITVVGYGMKKPRFEDLHAKALRWPTKGSTAAGKLFHYVGIDDEGNTAQEYQGEKQKGYRWYEKDMYGCHGKLLEKRKKRNPTRRFHPYFSSAPELADLLDWCPADNSGLQGIYPETLPWDLRVVGNGLGRGAKALREQAKQAKAGKLHLPDYRWLEIAREGH